MTVRAGVGALAALIAAACGGESARTSATPSPPLAAAAPAAPGPATTAAASEPAPAPLTKDELRPIVKAMVPALAACITTDARAGVVELALTIAGEPPAATTVTVDDVIVTGPLAADRAFRGCAIAALTAAPHLPLPRAGRASIRYPVTFDPAPPDNRDDAEVIASERAAATGDWRAALVAAETGLTRTSLDGPHRRRLIELAATAACTLGERDRARHYLALASAEIEARVRARCPTAP